MKISPVVDSKVPLTLQVVFEFPSLNRLLKIRVNPRTTTLKALSPILAEKFGADFAHIRLKFTPKDSKQEILDPVTPLYQIPYFDKNLEPKVEVDLEY